MKLYSPSSRSDFAFCPRMWWLRKQGWKSKRVGYPELCAIGGIAFGEAMHLWNTRRIAKQVVVVEELIAVGLQSVAVQVAELTAQDRRVTGLKDQEFLTQLPGWVEVAIQTIYAADPLKGHEVIASEHMFAEWGDMRADVISRDPQGELVVDDYKCKFGVFDVAWTDKEFEKHFDGEQRLYYTQAAGASKFGIVLVVVQPRANYKPGKPHVIRRVSRVQEHEVRLWKNDMVMDCAQMEGVEKQTNPWMVRGKAAPHANQYGECVYREACVEDGLDAGRMGVRYVQIDRKGVTGGVSSASE